jgi:hypothetical protein
MNKKQLQILLLVIIIGIGLLLALTASSFATSSSGSFQGAATQSLTPVATRAAQATSQPGSTDWITLTGVIIVLIVILPVLFRRSTWTK